MSIIKLIAMFVAITVLIYVSFFMDLKNEFVNITREDLPQIATDVRHGNACDANRCEVLTGKRVDWTIPEFKGVQIQIKEPNGRILSTFEISKEQFDKYIETKPGNKVTIIIQ